MDKYDLRYKNILCTCVDWENRIFHFKVDNHIYHFKYSYPLEYTADTDMIRHVINVFRRYLKNGEVKPAKDEIY